MARKVKTPLFLNNVEVRDIEGLRQNFNVAILAEYAFDGSLVKFLRERYYEDEADKVEALNKKDPDLENKLYTIFGIEKPEDPEITAWRRERLERLKNFTNDTHILARVDEVAFDQEDLGDLIDDGVSEIYLCNNHFRIPLKIKDKKYIGIGNAVAVIKSNEVVNFYALNIFFENINFDDAYTEICNKSGVILLGNNNFNDNTAEIPEYKEQITVSGNSAEATTTIKNLTGIHSRPASIFVHTASRFKSKINIASKGRKVDAKSILMIMSMNLTCGNEITISAKGSDAEEAVRTLLNLIESKFGGE